MYVSFFAVVCFTGRRSLPLCYPLSSLSLIFVAIVLSFILVILYLRRYRPILYPRYPLSLSLSSYPLSSLSLIFVAIVLSFILVILHLPARVRLMTSLTCY